MKHLLAIKDLDRSEIEAIISLAKNVKAHPKKYAHALEGMNLAMIFQKTSTRTNMSFAIGMSKLGGNAHYIDWKNSNFAVGNFFDDVRSIGGYADIIMARVYAQSDLERMAEAAGVPIINGLSDFEHPCQALADLLTIYEHKTGGIKVAYVGDGNNVCNSLIGVCTKMGIKIAIASPKGYEPNGKIVDEAHKTGLFSLTADPKVAVEGADFVYTDTWVSLGQEAEKEERMKVFPPYQLNKQLVPENAYVMHCLPAHRGYEIADDVIDGPNSIVFKQSDNRLYVQQAAMIMLLRGLK